MISALIYIVAVVLVIVSWKVCQWITYIISDTSIPGPIGLPMLGSALSVNPEKMHLNFYKWAMEYGQIFKVKMFGQTVIVLNDFDLVRKLFAGKDLVEFFNGRPDTFMGRFGIFQASDVILATKTDQKFLKLKRYLQTCLKRLSQNDRFQMDFKEEMKRLLDTFHDSRGEDLEFNSVFRHSLANVISILMSGEKVNNDESNRLWEFNDNTIYLLETSVNLFLMKFPLARFLPGKLGTVYKSMMLLRDWIIRKYFDKCKTNGSGADHGLVHALLQVQREENIEKGYDYITDDNIKGMIMDLIVAAMKTTHSAVSACFLVLLNNPEHINVIQNEIDQIVGHNRTPREADQFNMHYTRAVIYELLRYISHGSLGVPHLVTSNQHVNDYHFSHNDILLSNIWFIHHDPHFWDKPWDFYPQRFLDDDGYLLPASDAKMRRIATFSVGKRVCAGKDIALDRIFLYLTNILQTFTPMPPTDVNLPDADPRHYMPGLVLEPMRYRCRLVRRSTIKEV